MNKKVLVVVPSVGEGDGITKVYMSYYQELIAAGYSIDFLIVDKETNSFYSTLIRKNGGKIYSIPAGKYKFDKARIKTITKVFEENNYDIVHNNLPGPNGSIVLGIAKRKNISVRIYHVHNPRNNLSIKTKLSGALFYPRCIRKANFFMACSESAGKSVFNNIDYTILHNAIDPKKFEFDENAREVIRSEYNFSTKKVIGTICRMEYQKNPFFLIDCFYEYYKKNKNAVLLWVGEGSLKNKIVDYCKERRILDNVFFVGLQKEVGKWYSAMDMFILPSKFEGLGIVFLEAQSSGLPCLGSSVVPSDTEITELMHRLRIEDGVEKWCIEMEKLVNHQNDRHQYVYMFKKAGYDINYAKGKLVEVYNSLLNERLKKE